MSDIPSEIVADILSRVPARSLLRWRCASKSWRAIIDSPDFIKMHLNRTIQTNSDRKLIRCSDGYGCLHMADFDAVERTNKVYYLEPDHPLNRPYILGSCHGLVCLENSENDIVLWNPTTRIHFKLPSSDFEFKKVSAYGYGFGYDKVSDDYKVLRILQFGVSGNRVEVFSMKSKCWRKIPCFPYRLKYIRAHAVLAGGAFHWAVTGKQDSEIVNLIAAFDLGTEEYRLIPLPDDLKIEFYSNVALLGESLCVNSSYPYNFRRGSIWVMNKYAVKESWTKLFSFTELNFGTKPFYHVTPIAYSRSGHHVFMVQNENLPLWYDLKSRKITYSMFSISCSPEYMRHYMCFGSLVQLDGGISDSVGNAIGRKRGQGLEVAKALRKRAKSREMASC